MKQRPELDASLSMSIGLHVGKNGKAKALSVTPPDSKVTRIIRRKPRKPAPPKK